MRVRNIILATAFAVLPLVAVGADRLARPHEGLEIPPLPAFEPAEPQRHELENGIVVFLLEDHELPVVDLSGMLRAGSVWEPAEKTGLADICGDVMRSGGTERFPGDALDEALEARAASVEVSIGEDEASFAMSTLVEDVDYGIEVLADILQRPAFPEDKIALARRQMLASIARRNDDPGRIASRVFPRLIYGEDSPWVREPQPWTVAAIEQADLHLFHKRFFRPEGLVIGAWGDFDSTEMLAKIRRHFGGWERMKHEPPAPPPVATPREPGVYLVEKEEVTQTTLVVGHLGIVRRVEDTDWYALVIADEILGRGGFSSRLMNSVRTDLGLAYSIYSVFGAEYTHPGIFRVECETKSESTIAATRAIRHEIERMVTEPVTPDELGTAKESILNSLIFAVDSTGKLVQRQMRYAFNSFPTDMLQRFQEGIARVTADDVLRVAKDRIHPDELVILAVGTSADFDGDLSDLDLGDAIPLRTEPEPPPTATDEGPEPSGPEAEAAGRAIIEGAIEALGGLEAIRSVRTYAADGILQMQIGGNEIPVAYRMKALLPDRIRLELTTPQGVIVQAASGGEGWMQTPQGTQEMPAAMARELVRNLQTSPLFLLQAVVRGEATATAVGTGRSGGKACQKVRIRGSEGIDTVLLIEEESRLPARRDTEQPEGTVRVRFSDWREAAGVGFPFTVEVNRGGLTIQRTSTKRIAVNEDVAERDFLQPAAGGGGKEDGEGEEEEAF